MHGRKAAGKTVMFSRWTLTLLLAGLLGAVTAWSFAPQVSADERVAQLVDDDPKIRQRAWAWMAGMDDKTDGRRVVRLLGQINSALKAAEDDVLLEASAHLRQAGLWHWAHQPASLVLREASLLAKRDRSLRHVAVVQMADAPLDLDPDDAMAAFSTLLDETSGSLHHDALAAAMAWIGPERRQLLLKLPVLDEETTRGTIRRAVYWASKRGQREPQKSSWSHLDEAAARRQLDASVVDEDGHVYAAALLAEHALTRSDAIALAEQWIVDLDNDRKRAGALLATLLGEHAALLKEAFAAATDGRVRTTLRIALHSLGRPVGNEHPMAFAHRALHHENDINPDIVLCLLAGGQHDALAYLAQRPEAPSAASIRPRNLLIERFLPNWHVHAAVEDDGSDPVTTYFDAIDIVYTLTHRWLAFDAQRRVYE